MPNVSLTGIEFTIKGTSNAASASVDKLIQKLSNLNAELAKGNNAQAYAKGIDSIAKAVEKLSNLSLGGAASVLSQLAQALQPLKEVGDAAKGVGSFANGLAKLADNPEGLANVAVILAQIAAIDFSNISEAGEGLRDIAAAARALAGIGSNTVIGEPVKGFDRIRAFAAKAASAVRNLAKNLALLPFRMAAKAAGGFADKLKTVVGSLKRILFYRIIRGIIKFITQAFQEGLKNAYQFDKIAGGQLAESLDRIATTSLTMKNQLGAAFGGLLTALTPIIVGVIRLVTSLASAITRLIAILGGSGQWLKAKDVWTEWGEAAEGAGGAAKEALKYLAPFDELNVLPSERGGGGGGGGADYGDMFEWVSTEEGSGFLDALTGAFKSVGEWFESKDWQDIGAKAWQTLKEVFTDGTKANEAVSAFMEAVGAAFGAIVGTAWGFISNLVDDLVAQFKKNLVDYNGDGKLTAVDFLMAVLKTGGDVVSWVYETLVKPFFDGFGRALTGDNTFDFSKWATDNILNPMITAINTAIQHINENIGTNIPTIPLIATVEEVKVDIPTKEKTLSGFTADVTKASDNIPEKKKKSTLWRIDVSDWNDAIAAKAKEMRGFTAAIAKFKADGIKRTERMLNYFQANLTKYSGDGIPKGKRQLTSFNAYMTSFSDTGIAKDTRKLGNFKANLTKFSGDGIAKEKRALGYFKANLTKFSGDGIAKDRRKLGYFTANLSTFASDAISVAKRVLGSFTANVTGIKDGLNSETRKIMSTAKVTKTELGTNVDPYNTGRITLSATARIDHVIGTEVALNGVPSGNGINSNSYSVGADEGVGEDVLYRAFSRALADSELGGDISLDGEVLYKRMVSRNKQNTRLTGVNAMA